MGLFSAPPKPDGELRVEFYDDPSDVLQEGLVSVTYTPASRSVARAVQDYRQYLAKVVYCLGPGSTADRLTAVIARALDSGLTTSSDVLHGDGYSLRLVEPQDSPTKFCHAKFFADRQPITDFSYGGEDYYPPMSCLAFLQHLIARHDLVDVMRLGVGIRTGTIL